MYLTIAGKGIYHSGSDHPPPALAESLEATQKAILMQYFFRVSDKHGDNAMFWDGVVKWMGRSNANTASRIVSTFDLSSAVKTTKIGRDWAPGPSHSLKAAVAYWVEAAAAKDSNEPARSWAALIQSNFYLGMASGPFSTAENAASAGSKQPEQHQIFRNVLLAALAKLNAKSEESRASAIRTVMSEIEIFKPESTGASAAPEAGTSEEAAIAKLINGWVSGKAKDRELCEAFDRVQTGPAKRGRKPGSSQGKKRSKSKKAN